MNYKDELKYFSKVLKEHRIKTNLSAYKLGQSLGLKSNTGYSRLENSGNPSLNTLLMLSEKLNVDIEIKNGKIFVFD